MATSTKLKNGKMPQDVLQEATKAAEEAKQVMDTMLEATSKAVEDSKPILQAYRKLLNSNSAFWEEYSQSNMSFMSQYTQQVVDKWFSFREEWDKMIETNLKKSQDLFVAEQTLAFEAAEAFQAQVQAASERAAKMITPLSTN